MVSFEFKRSARKCAITERTFAPGERYVSAVFREEDAIVRKDFAETEWHGPSEDCIGWWTCIVPQLDTGKVYWAPNDVLLSYFESTLEIADNEAASFVTALLLVQKRILHLQDMDDESALHLVHKKTKTNYEVAVVDLGAEEKVALQQELSEQLFTDQAPQTGESSE